MLAIYGVNLVITLIAWFVICFAMPDVDLALEHPSLYPVIYVMEQSMSMTWVTVMLTLIVALVLFANVGETSIHPLSLASSLTSAGLLFDSSIS